jgi:hypothetical protein
MDVGLKNAQPEADVSCRQDGGLMAAFIFERSRDSFQQRRSVSRSQ